MPRISAGLLLYRRAPTGLEVLLVHPGGPFFRYKDLGAWSIPKGEVAEGEDLLATARREFAEETGTAIDGAFQRLAPVRQKSGKIVHAWAVEGTLDPTRVRSNTMRIEWPPRSGRTIVVPEVDRAAFFPVPEALRKINGAQSAFVRELVALVEPVLPTRGPDMPVADARPMPDEGRSPEPTG